MKRLFIDKDYQRKEKPENYSFVPSTVFENDFIMENDPTYVEVLENLPENRRKAMLYGDWDVYEGQFFTDWRNNSEGYIDRRYTHVVTPFTIPDSWTRYRVMDWGYAKPFSVGWYAVNEDDQAFRYARWYGCTGEPDVGLRMTPEQVAMGIKEYEDEYEKGRYIHGVADPAVFATDTGKSVAETFQECGIYFEPADNSRLTGWNQMRERMKFDSEGRAMLYTFSDDKHFIRTIPSLLHDETKVEDLDTTQEDHIADECRYFCMARPIKARIVRPTKPKIYNPLETEQKIKPGLGFLRL